MSFQDSPRIIFLGSSSFAVPSLKSLVESKFFPLVITKPDKPSGRGKKTGNTPIKKAAQELGLNLLQPETLKAPEVHRKFQQEAPLLIISIAYGDYIPPEILKLPRAGCVNLHPSLLPKYRGAAPVQRAIMAGDKETGITLAYVTPQWDAGDVLMQEPAPIEVHDTSGSLLQKLAIKGGSMLQRALPLLLEGKLSGVPQESSKATFAPKIKESESWIDWNAPAVVIFNLVRGLAPAPSAKTKLSGKLIKIHQVELVSGRASPGEIADLREQGPVIGTGTQLLVLRMVQPENRKIISGKDFINGYRLQKGQIFEG